MSPVAQYFRDRFERVGALWTHKGGPQRPHAVLTSGQHSDGYFNSGLVCQDPLLLDEVAQKLVTQIHTPSGAQLEDIDWVVGPAMGAITLAQNIARHIALFSGAARETCCSTYAEKFLPQNPCGTMHFSRIAPKAGSKVLIVEDVLTTGGSVIRLADAVMGEGAVVLPLVLTLVNRSGKSEIDGRQIVSLLDLEIKTWAEGECPLCRAGSDALHPKEAGAWKRLTAA